MSAHTAVSRSLQTIKRDGFTPERVEEAILAAISAGFCLASDGDDHTAGFSDDIARNHRNFGQPLACA